MNQTRIKTIFHFHELSLPVIEHEGGEFVPVKPIIEHIGMNWRTALRTLQTDSRTKFFHFQHLNVPLPSGLGGSCATQTPVILLQKVHFYIAQLNPDLLGSREGIRAAIDKRLAEWCPTMNRPKKHCNLVYASRWADDGYGMAKELEICFSWEMDFNTVEELDSFNSFVRTALEAAEKAWAEENRIQPPLATGTKITYKRGWEQKTGEISGIYKFWPACYTIQEDGAPSNMSAVLKYEDVQAV